MFKLACGLSPSSYRREWLAKDVVAGIVLSTLLVLYTSILCLLGYAVFGPSRILVLGPDSSLGPMIAATILPLAGANGDPKRAIALASMLALMVGAILVLGAVAKLGFIADLISKPTMIGYMNGLALTILVGQLPKLFGFKVDADGFIGELTGFFKGLVHGDAVAAAAADVDTTASDMLEELDETLNAQHTSLVFAELKDPVRRKIERYGLTRTIDPRHFYPTIESAVAAFREETGADWTAAITRDAGEA
jgi:MFS superfamily sulfate permease-like transporter